MCFGSLFGSLGSFWFTLGGKEIVAAKLVRRGWDLTFIDLVSIRGLVWGLTLVTLGGYAVGDMHVQMYGWVCRVRFCCCDRCCGSLLLLLLPAAVARCSVLLLLAAARSCCSLLLFAVVAAVRCCCCCSLLLLLLAAARSASLGSASMLGSLWCGVERSGEMLE